MVSSYLKSNFLLGKKTLAILYFFLLICVATGRKYSLKTSQLDDTADSVILLENNVEDNPQTHTSSYGQPFSIYHPIWLRFRVFYWEICIDAVLLVYFCD